MLTKRLCMTDPLHGPVRALGLCQSCYRLVRRTGSVVRTRVSHRERIAFYETNVVRVTDECISWPYIWPGHLYGALTVNGETKEVHVRSCEYWHGPRPADELEVCHSCHHPDCFNGRHVRWDTRAANSHDRIADGTMCPMQGDDHPLARLNSEQVMAIRRKYKAGGVMLIELSKEYGVSHSNIRMIVNRRTWKHLPPDPES